MGDFFRSSHWRPVERWHTLLTNLQRELDIWIYRGDDTMSADVYRVEWRVGGMGQPLLGGATYYSHDDARAKAVELREQFGTRAVGWEHVVAHQVA